MRGGCVPLLGETPTFVFFSSGLDTLIFLSLNTLEGEDFNNSLSPGGNKP